jgi:hypothetical protein
MGSPGTRKVDVVWDGRVGAAGIQFIDGVFLSECPKV